VSAFTLHCNDGRDLEYDPGRMSLALWSNGTAARVEVRLRETGQMIFVCGTQNPHWRVNAARAAAWLVQQHSEQKNNSSPG
jgi:hypothetical protein